MAIDPRDGRLTAFAGTALALVLLMTGCAAPPDVDALVDQASATPAAPNVVGARGPLSDRQSKAVLAKLQQESQNATVLERHLALEAAVDEAPLTAGNKVTLLRDGGATIPAMFAAIRAAKTHVNLEYFIFDDIEDHGAHLSDLLVERVSHGVDVNVIYDSIGSDDTPSELFDRLKTAGVHLVDFNPASPLDGGSPASINDRDHRKILIVDGRVAFVGGVNLSKVYMNPPTQKFYAGDAAKRETTTLYWRDTDVEVEGPVVAQLQHLFLDTWQQQSGAAPPDHGFFPKLDPAGTEVIQIFGSSPDQPVPEYYVALLTAIRNAESRVWLTTGYFVPTHDERKDLIRAARRGVDVRLLLPGESDSDLALEAGHASYSDLLEAGVQIYERQGSILHSKTAVIDGVWSEVGSSNFDHRSILFNNEVDAVILGGDTGAQLEAMFQDDLKNAGQITLEAWRNRPLWGRLHEFFSRIWQSLL
jgi:cardiolipin synthase A/B